MKNAVVIIEEENVVEPMRRKTPGRKDSGKWQQTLHCTAKKKMKKEKKHVTRNISRIRVFLSAQHKL